jgi:predicted transcriptional regulator
MLPCSHRGRRHAALADLMAGTCGTVRSYNKYLWSLLMPMLRRSKDKIIADIFEVCLMPGLAKTNVVYQANLNFKTALPYLDLLTRGGLLETVPGESTIYFYKTTAKGRKALKALRAIEKIIPERLD